MGKAAALLGQQPLASMARASCHSTSHDLAPHSLATLHQCRGGWSSSINSSKTPQCILELFLCPLCSWPALPMASSLYRSNGLTHPLTQQDYCHRGTVFEWRFNAKSFADKIFCREHFYLCHKKANRLNSSFHHLKHLTQVLLPLADCRLIPCILLIFKIMPALRYIKTQYNKYFN